jgi:hypothetical protein
MLDNTCDLSTMNSTMKKSLSVGENTREVTDVGIPKLPYGFSHLLRGLEVEKIQKAWHLK